MYWNVATLMPPLHPAVTSEKLVLNELAATVAGGAPPAVVAMNVPQNPAFDAFRVIADPFSFSMRSLLAEPAIDGTTARATKTAHAASAPVKRFMEDSPSARLCSGM